jgi:hypothetical protein
LSEPATGLRPRRPWLAALANLLVPGLGLLYAGSLPQAITWLAVTFGLGLFAGGVVLWLSVKPLNEILTFIAALAVPVGGWYIG